MLDPKIEETYRNCLSVLDNFMIGCWNPKVKKGVKIARDLLEETLCHEQVKADHPDWYDKPIKVNESIERREKLWKKFNGA